MARLKMSMMVCLAGCDPSGSGMKGTVSDLGNKVRTPFFMSNHRTVWANWVCVVPFAHTVVTSADAHACCVILLDR